MIRLLTAFVMALGFFLPAAPAVPTLPGALVTVRNPIDLDRPHETIVLHAADLRRLLSVEDPRRVHVLDERTGQELLAQAVDTNDDGQVEELIYQTDIGPLETRKFQLSVGDRQVPRREDFKAYARFVQERRDDFAWENDRIAHRMYGAALETWAQEPLTSSAVDVWCKRVRRLIINDWYMVDDYHRDHGEGADFYSAGTSRGCGGNGLWVAGRLYPSANFRHSRVFANGPIRVIFELTYDAWDAGGVRVSEVKRIILDAGQNLNRFESRYTIHGETQKLTHAIGIKKNAGAASSFSREQGSLRTWEPLKEDAGQLGCGVLINPTQIVERAEDKGNSLVVARVAPEMTAAYYAGFGWTKSGDFLTVEDWDRYLSQFATRLRSPLKVTVTAR
ncbi:MAG: DUF4861 domain-containing protein [Acidobacteriia bacterium]|nr:DUF4861 domain-containing protein [Terriglobia bacterium]